MVCFPVVGYDEEISQTLKYFFDESSKFCKHIFFVGTKTELRAEKDRAIQFKQGKELAKELKGEAYLECSAQDNDGSVEEVFKEVAKRASTGKDQLDSLSLSPKTHNGLRREASQQLSPKERFQWAVRMVLQYKALTGYKLSDTNNSSSAPVLPGNLN